MTRDTIKTKQASTISTALDHVSQLAVNLIITEAAFKLGTQERREAHTNALDAMRRLGQAILTQVRDTVADGKP